MSLKIGIANDHAGYELKIKIVEYLTAKGYEVENFGTDSTESVDYPDYAHPLALAVEQGLCDRGIAICCTGNGINMTVNKHQGIRAALCWTEDLSRMARAHNDANICSLSARYISAETALSIVDVFLHTDFEGGRHLRRIQKMPVALKNS